MKVAIYCRVIDNYGDAGVCWRLARQLATEHHCRVRLWIDHPPALARLLGGQPGSPAAALAGLPEGAAGEALPLAQLDGVAVHRWAVDAAGTATAGLPQDDDLVIAAFGCELPPDVRRRMAPAVPGSSPPPVWINLEYLSAEAWTSSVNGQKSVKPFDRAVEYFLCPGFGAGTAGLLREAGLIERRRRFHAQGRAAGWLAGHQVPARPDAHRVSLFCYDTPLVEQLLQAMADGHWPIQLLVPQGVAPQALQRWCGAAPLPGQTLQRGALTLQGLNWLPQQDYDRLLWSCELNLVRGEDSWVRGHWAGLPLLWQPYPQPQAAHLPKLDAWLDGLARGAADAAGQLAPLRRLAHAWSGDGDLAGAWPAFAAQLWGQPGPSNPLARQFSQLCDRLSAAPDLATTLLQFARSASDRLK